MRGPCRWIPAAAAMLVALAGCANSTPTQERDAAGTAGGAAARAATSAIAGDAGMGPAIGAGGGLLGGLAVDQTQMSRERAYQEGVAAGKRQSGN